MKKNEIALLILVMSIVGFVTYLTLNALLGKASSQPVDVEKAEAFQTGIVEPSDSIFNGSAINPTVKVKIGDQSGQQPFTINQ